MSKLILSFFVGAIFFAGCKKEDLVRSAAEVVIPCELQTDNPAGRSYEADEVVSYNCTDKHCGILPLSVKNYWVYEDSIYSYGTLLRVQFDTLRYAYTKKSMEDGLIWWQGNLTIGLPDMLYANDSAFFKIGDRMFTPGIKDARKDYPVPAGDSVKYLTSFDDIAANGRSVRLKTPVTSPAGSFEDCIYFEKNARFFRRDQLFFKPGIGVIKYIQEKAPPGNPLLKLQQVSTLVAVHIE